MPRDRHALPAGAALADQHLTLDILVRGRDVDDPPLRRLDQHLLDLVAILGRMTTCFSRCVRSSRRVRDSPR